MCAKDIIEQCHQELKQAKRGYNRQWVKKHLHQVENVLGYGPGSPRRFESKSPKVQTKNFREINKQRIAKLALERKEK